MASTITLNNTISWAQQFVRNRPLQFTSLSVLEPALTSANLVKLTMLSPPFVWRWNRFVQSVTLAGGTQDYITSVPTFGWIETGAILDQDASPAAYKQLEVKTSLELETSQARPNFVAAQADNNTGNITFRFMPVPDAADTAELTCQAKPTLFTALTQTWTPIPDEYSHVYNWLFLALMFLYTDDARFQAANQKGIAGLLSVAQGLSQSQVNIFLNNWQAVTGSPLAMTATQAQGEQARGI